MSETPPIRQRLDEAVMSRFQWMAIAICVMLIMLDGFDVLVMAFTAASVSAEWQLSGAQLGILFSAALLGMAAGSLCLAPQADRFGRQPIIVLCLVIVSLGMLASAFTQSYLQLAAMRAITGIGIGGMLASVGVITAEYASKKWRSTCIAFQAAGYPLGATIGGSIAAILLAYYGWRSVFIFGGGTTALFIPVVLWRLPESVDFLIAKRPANALNKLNALLIQLKQPTLSAMPALPARTVGQAAGSSVLGLFRQGRAPATLLLWCAFFLLMFSFYFTLSWTPKLLVAAGLSAKQGITGGVLLNVGGIIGGTVFGLLSARFSLGRLTAISLLLTALAVALFGSVTTSLSLAFVVAFAIGLFIFAAMAGLYAFSPVIYDATVRTTGMGWAIGVGRIGAILAPLAAGTLVDDGWQASQLYYAYALPLVLAALMVMLLKHSRRSFAA